MTVHTSDELQSSMACVTIHLRNILLRIYNFKLKYAANDFYLQSTPSTFITTMKCNEDKDK